MASESVRIDATVVGIYRSWASASGRSLSGLMEMVLRQALCFYNEGRIAGTTSLADDLTRTLESSHGTKAKKQRG